MKYSIKKPYSGIIVSGQQVDFVAGEVFDSSEDFIVKGDMLVCRIDSDFFKEYFTEEIPHTADSGTAIVDTLQEISDTLDSIVAGGDDYGRNGNYEVG